MKKIIIFSLVCINFLNASTPDISVRNSSFNNTYQQKGKKLYEEQRNSYSKGETFSKFKPINQAAYLEDKQKYFNQGLKNSNQNSDIKNSNVIEENNISKETQDKWESQKNNYTSGKNEYSTKTLTVEEQKNQMLQMKQQQTQTRQNRNLEAAQKVDTSNINDSYQKSYQDSFKKTPTYDYSQLNNNNDN